jgi:hypothetical protein
MRLIAASLLALCLNACTTGSASAPDRIAASASPATSADTERSDASALTLMPDGSLVSAGQQKK